MGRTIILVHGRHFKPPRAAMRRLWIDALRAGLERDHPRRLPALDRARIEFVYYGDLSNAFLAEALNEPVPDDLHDRRRTLRELKRYRREQFSRRVYAGLPGRSGAGEALADLFGGLASTLRLADPILGAVAPDVCEYWNPESAFGSEVRERMIRPLRLAMNRKDPILVIAHSLGTLLAWDTLWKFSRTGEYRPRFADRRVDLLLTLGSPLADETVKRHLKGAPASGARRYPANIRRWVNVAAEDDYIAHDERVENDYRAMKRHGLIEEIRDKRIYGLAVRHGRSNPHSSAGYLIHPFVADVVADWLG